jgi:hypothetical protein
MATVGVLLPVRLETRFVTPVEGAGWRLRVRVIPDAVSITNHDDRPSALELDAVEAMWSEVGASGAAGLESATGRRAWRTLATTVGAERAAWLARTFPPGTPRPNTVRDDFRAPHLMGLPPTIEVWIGRAGRPPQRMATMTVRADEVDLDLQESDRTDQPWWTSFDEAVRVGLAADIDLGEGAPDDLDVVYVVGIGAGDPGPLLTAQAHSGRLGVLALGAATSTVSGVPAAPLGDADTWRKLVADVATSQAGTSAAADALVGEERLANLPAVVGGAAHAAPVGRALVRTLWPALWGHSLANVAGQGNLVDDLGVWAGDHLAPEGPLPPLRIGDTSYGLLPATSLRRWKAASGDPAVERRLVPLVADLVDRWAAAAEVREAGPARRDGLDALVRSPLASAYRWRTMVPTTLARAVAFRFGQPIGAVEMDRWFDATTAGTARLVPTAVTERRLVAVGWSQPMTIGLVVDVVSGLDHRDALSALADASVSEAIAGGGDGVAPPWGRSLLTELARHSLLSSAAAVGRVAAGGQRAVTEPLAVDARRPTELERWAVRADAGDLLGDTTPARIHRNVRAGLRDLSTFDPDDVERSLRATLDTATHRIDPWATAIAWRRLQSLAAADRDLGVYGWVDAPRPTTGDHGHRFLTAPSREQAITAAVLRDRYERDPDGDQTWAIDLTSDHLRTALRLATETRSGVHPAETLGQTVERIVGRPDVIDRLRDAFPQQPAVLRPRFKLRRTIDGPAVLDAAVDGPAALTGLGVTTAQVAELVELSNAVDAFADLQVAEAIHGVVTGRPAAVAAAAEAAAGVGMPPEPGVIRTRRDGRTLETIVAVVLPVPALTGDGPAAIADPAVAAFLDDRAGDPAGPAWQWTTHDDAGQPQGTVTLDGIGLRPCETVLLGIDQLRALAASTAGAPSLAPEDPSGPRTVRTWASAIVGSVNVGDDIAAAGVASSATTAELAARLDALRAAAATDITSIRAATAPAATAAQHRAAELLATRWGVIPHDTGDDVDRLIRAAVALERRLAMSFVPSADSPSSTFADAIVALIAPEGGWPVLARVPGSVLADTVLEGRAVEGGAVEGGAVTPRLDPDWLEVVAAVRPALARFEAAQLGAGSGRLAAWSNRPGDPWQTSPGPGLLAVFGPAEAVPTQPSGQVTVALAVIDRFAETVPAEQHVAAVAFPHDLPPARAPQAVLLAVPPVVDDDLTTDVLIDVLGEVRALARARMASPGTLGAAVGSLHLAAMPAAGRTGVRLGGG